jgi:hypothetical protein
MAYRFRLRAGAVKIDAAIVYEHVLFRLERQLGIPTFGKRFC